MAVSPSLNQAQSKNIFLIGGFDGHGSSTTLAVARTLGVSFNNVILQAPNLKIGVAGTGPEGLPSILNSLALFKQNVHIFDIAIDVKNPTAFLNALENFARNNDVTFYDHHSTNTRYLQYIPQNVRFVQFDSAYSMLEGLKSSGLIAEAEQTLALVGVICDRDPGIRKANIDEKEFQTLYNLANNYDYLIRNDFTTTIRGVYGEGVEYIRRVSTSVKYPPSELAKQIEVVKKEGSVALVRMPRVDMWMWKVLDEYARVNTLDYIVFITTVIDRQTNTEVPIVGTMKFWLSDVPEPKPIILSSMSSLKNRKIIGHDSAFTIQALSSGEAQSLAEEIYNVLISQFSSTARLLGATSVADAIQKDYLEILRGINKILELQATMYREYLDLKRQQVELLKQASNSNANSNVHRYD